MKQTLIALFILSILVGCEKGPDPVDVVHEQITGSYVLESVSFPKDMAVDLNNDGVTSEDVLAELKMLPEYGELADEVGAVVECDKSVDGKGDVFEEYRNSGKIDISLFLQFYERSSQTVPGPATEWTERMFGYIKTFNTSYQIEDSGFLAIDFYQDDLTGEYVRVSFPEKDVMKVITNIGFHDYASGYSVGLDSEWIFVRSDK